jgi:putative DNA methylase
MTKPKKLIEVAMPVKEISAESVRDKSIRHGHISTLHLWWARRPLPVCRAVVFASLVPDPLDENCPEQFKKAVEILLGKNNDLPGDPYKPYKDIPHTAVVDKMEDNLRNRLLMFIGKFSDKYLDNEKLGKKTASKDQMNQFSLITWDNKNEDKVIVRARKLIFVSHNAKNGKTTKELLSEYDCLNKAIKKAESDLYNYPNRHIETNEVKQLEKAKDKAIATFLSNMPKVFDPFAGGGAIPLEASRLGCNSYGNDINPVAHIIQKGSCVFPQKFGKQITYSKGEFVKIYGDKELQKQQIEGNVFGDDVNIANRLAYDVEFFAKKLLKKSEKEIGHYYPKDKNGKHSIAYYWVRIGKCANPSCSAEVPLLRGFYLVNKSDKKLYLNPIIKNKNFEFEIKSGSTDRESWMHRANLKCPICSNITTVNNLKEQFHIKKPAVRLLAVIEESSKGKQYRLPTEKEIDSSLSINIDRTKYPDSMDNGNYRDLKLPKWGHYLWSDMFTNRQLFAMQTFLDQLEVIKKELGEDLSEYNKAVIVYLGILIDRIAQQQTSFGLIKPNRETFASPFGRQAIPMVFDFPESNPFCQSSGGALNQLDWILRYINSESYGFESKVNHAASGEKNQYERNELNVTVTDPPYYDAIAYADLSDFFYIWMKKSILDLYPLNFATPQTPKNEECTALKHHHNDNMELAFNHFEEKLLEIFSAIEYQTSDIVSIMFAHQSTKAWTTLCNSILGARMNITGSWAMDTEMQNRNLAISGNALETSVTVACKPSTKSDIGDYKEVQKEILIVIKDEVKLLYELGFRGADLLTACFGQAVSVFGKYESVEKADGSGVTVAELLEMAREAAFDAIVSDIDTDELTKFYIGWLNLFGFSEAVHDDVRRISQIGLSVDISEIYSQNILVKNGDKGTLGTMKARITQDSRLGLRPVNNSGIDIAHRLMYLYHPKNGSRSALLDFISEKAPNSESSVWRVLNSLAELLPKSSDMNDRELAVGLLSNQENLIREAKNRDEKSGVQGALDFE